MTEEKKTNVEVPAAKETATAIPAMVDSTAAAPIVLSQAPMVAASEAKPVVDKPSTITASVFPDKK